MIAWLLVGVLWAAGPAAACPAPPELAPASTVSVAWVAPASRRVGARGFLTVVPTDALRAWIATERPDLGRVLQALGLRRRADPPDEPWVVGVFEVPALYLCRPVDLEPGVPYAGLATCATGDATGGHRVDPCANARDLGRGGAPGLPLLRVRWEDAAARGFCVLPARRFVAGG